MPALAAHLQAAIGPGLSDEDRDLWAQLSVSIEQMGLEAALLATAPSASLETAIAAAAADLILSSERKVIAEVFEGKRTLRFTRLLGHLLKPRGGLPVVTTNYDRLVEIASEEAGLGADTMFVGQFAGEFNQQESRMSFCREAKMRGKQIQLRFRDRVNVYKPHGSLDWYHRAGRPVRYAGDLAVARLIITPGLNKFRNGYESPFDGHRERANAAIDRASRFLVIGYGFNDDHLETHLTPMIRDGKPTLLLTYELSTTAFALAQDCSNVIALDRAIYDGAPGTRVIVNRTEVPLPGLAFWDLHNFISEVLEP